MRMFLLAVAMMLGCAEEVSVNEAALETVTAEPEEPLEVRIMCTPNTGPSGQCCYVGEGDCRVCCWYGECFITGC